MYTLSQPLLSCILSIFLLPFVVGKRDGLSIKLIHRDSVESPLYVANQTVEEILDTLSDRSSIHIKQITTATTNQTLVPEQIIPPVVYDGEFYLAHVGIGTFRTGPGEPGYKSYYLMVDTASSFIWLQCEGCDPCYTQKEPFYPYGSSSTYRALSCQERNRNCVYGKCDSGTCVYTTNYAAKSVSKGDVSTEKFTFRSDNGAFETVDGLYFGCGLAQKDFNFHVNPALNEVSGIMGLARGPMSLLSQLGVRARNQFSYCLQPRFNGNNIAAISTSLRFGSHASFKPWHRAVKVTLLLNPTNRFNYFVDLQGLSLVGTRLNFNAHAVRKKGGVVLDLGSPLTLISREEYSVVRGAMWQYFSNMGLVETRKRRMDLCFNNPEGFNQFPSMTFHFKGVLI